MGKKIGKFAIGAVFAAVFGYLAGILTAPKSGKETRKDIHDAATKARDEAEEKFRQMQVEIDDLLEKAKHQFVDKKGDAQVVLAKAVEQATIARAKATEMIDALHAGHADDKHLEKAVQDVMDAMKNLKIYLAKNDKGA